MLPKVANHIFLHTSRAVAAVQNQTGHTLRNVLQLQSSAPSAPTTWTGAGSSSWGSSGAGPGGAKFNAGSRFYNGYTVSLQCTFISDMVLISYREPGVL
jgi:hypothetical protein